MVYNTEELVSAWLTKWQQKHFSSFLKFTSSLFSLQNPRPRTDLCAPTNPHQASGSWLSPGCQTLTLSSTVYLFLLFLLWPCHCWSQIFSLLAPRGCNDFRTAESLLISCRLKSHLLKKYITSCFLLLSKLHVVSYLLAVFVLRSIFSSCFNVCFSDLAGNDHTMV